VSSAKNKKFEQTNKKNNNILIMMMSENYSVVFEKMQKVIKEKIEFCNYFWICNYEYLNLINII